MRVIRAKTDEKRSKISKEKGDTSRYKSSLARRERESHVRQRDNYVHVFREEKKVLITIEEKERYLVQTHFLRASYKI